MADTKPPKGIICTPKARTSPLLHEYLVLEKRHEDIMDELDKIWYRLTKADRKRLDGRKMLVRLFS